MRLRRSQVENYARLVSPDAPQAVVDELLSALESGNSSLEDLRVSQNAKGEILAAVRLHRIGPGHWIVLIVGARPGARRLIDVLMLEAAERADIRNVSSLMARIPEAWMDASLTKALYDAGFKNRGRRLAWKEPLEPLCSVETGSTRLQWKQMARPLSPPSVGLLARVAVGDPLAPPNMLNALQEWLQTDGMIAEVWVGLLDETAVAWCCTQVIPKTGWSRVTYMGVDSPHRGRGLGVETHEFCLRRIRAMGGVIWEGGCSATNQPMSRILQKLGRSRACHEFQRDGLRRTR